MRDVIDIKSVYFGRGDSEYNGSTQTISLHNFRNRNPPSHMGCIFNQSITEMGRSDRRYQWEAAYDYNREPDAPGDWLGVIY